MTTPAKWAPSKNQLLDLSRDYTTEGEQRIYEMYRHFWHPVAYTHELQPDIKNHQLLPEPLKVTLCGQDLVLVKLNGEIQAFNDVCPHKGTRLSLGKVVEGPDGKDALRCGYHGWQYGINGECTHIPQRPDLIGKVRACVKPSQTRVAYGMVWVCLEDESHFPFPEFPEWDDPEWTFLPVPATNWNCAATRRIENYCDLLHFAFVHDKLLGEITKPEIPEHKVWREDPGVLRMTFDKITTYREGPPGARPLAKRNYYIYMPTTIHLHLESDGAKYLLFFHPSPVGPKEVRNFTIAGSTFSSHESLYEDLITVAELTYAQDKALVESQRPGMLQEDISFEIYLKDADTFTLNYRIWLVQLAKELAS